MISPVNMDLENLPSEQESTPCRTPKSGLLLLESKSNLRGRLADTAVAMDADIVEIESWDEIWNAVQRFASSCVVVPMPDEGPNELLARSHSRETPVAIVFVVEHVSPSRIVEVMQQGAAGVISQTDSIDDIRSQLERVLAQNNEMQKRFDFTCQQRARIARLNEKEKAVLKSVLMGLPNKAIAKKLEVSQRTIESRRHDIFQKTETANLVALTKLVYEANIHIDFDDQEAQSEANFEHSIA